MGPLADVGELENHLQRPLDPVVAAQALLLASGAVRAYCNWDLSFVAGETLQVDGSGTAVLNLPTLWLVDVTEVRINGEPIDITATAVSWSKRGQLFRPVGWPLFAQIEADVDHGYTVIPDLIKLVTLEHAARTLNNPQGLLSASAGSVSRTYAGADKPRLSALDERLLSRYAL